MKKKIVIPYIIVLLILIAILPLAINKKDNNKMMFLSNYLWSSYLEENKISELKKTTNFDDIYYDYVYNSLSSKLLLRYLQENTNKISSSSLSLHTQIKNSKVVLLNIGLEDFISDIKVISNMAKLEYDKDIMSLHADVFINIFHQIVDEIYLINPNIKLYCSSFYYPYPYYRDEELANFFNLINDDINEIITNEKGVYLDISSYSQEKYFDSTTTYKLNTLGLNNILNNIFIPNL